MQPTPLPCPASAAHTMDILFYVTWEVVVKDMCYVMDIQPSRCQVCGDQDTNSTWKTRKHCYYLINLIVQPLLEVAHWIQGAPKLQFLLLEAGKAHIFLPVTYYL